MKVVSIVLIFAAAAFAQPAKKSWTMPRTPDGHPDLQGVWTNATLTPMERPAQFAGKATVTDAEAKAYEQNDLEGQRYRRSESAVCWRARDRRGTGGYNNLFIDRGSELARVDGVKRTSLIIDPPDGHIPHRQPRAASGRRRPGRRLRRHEL